MVRGARFRRRHLDSRVLFMLSRDRFEVQQQKGGRGGVEPGEQKQGQKCRNRRCSTRHPSPVCLIAAVWRARVERRGLEMGGLTSADAARLDASGSWSPIFWNLSPPCSNRCSHIGESPRFTYRGAALGLGSRLVEVIPPVDAAAPDSVFAQCRSAEQHRPSIFCIFLHLASHLLSSLLISSHLISASRPLPTTRRERGGCPRHRPSSPRSSRLRPTQSTERAQTGGGARAREHDGPEIMASIKHRKRLGRFWISRWKLRVTTSRRPVRSARRLIAAEQRHEYVQLQYVVHRALRRSRCAYEMRWQGGRSRLM